MIWAAAHLGYGCTVMFIKMSVGLQPWENKNYVHALSTHKLKLLYPLIIEILYSTSISLLAFLPGQGYHNGICQLL